MKITKKQTHTQENKTKRTTRKDRREESREITVRENLFALSPTECQPQETKFTSQ
jgi:hypothetical protein